MGSKDSKRRKFQEEVEGYLAHQKELSEKLWPNRQLPATTDELVEAATQASEIEMNFGIPEATWARKTAQGPYEVVIAPICPPGFKSVEAIIHEEARADPRVARYLKSAQDFIAGLEAKEGKRGPGFMSRFND